MFSLQDLEKKINSELTTKINTSKINHSQIFINIDSEDLIDVILFLIIHRSKLENQICRKYDEYLAVLEEKPVFGAE